LGAFVLFLGAAGCFSSAAPSQVPQLPQPPPILVERAIPAPVPEVLRELARRLAAIPDNHPAADLAHQAATGIRVYAQTADCVTVPPTVIQLAPVVNSAAPVKPPEDKTPAQKAKAWWEHVMDAVGWVAIAVGIGIIALNVGQALLTPPWWLGLIREAKDMAFGVGFTIVGILCIRWPWPVTFLVGGLAVAYIAWRVGKAKAKP
jgi:hypothetical protein